DILECEAERAGLFAVDHQIDLRRLWQSLDMDLPQNRAGVGLGHELVGGPGQGRITFLRAILQTEAEAGRIPEIVYRWWFQRCDLGVSDRGQIAVDVGDDRGGRIFLAPF